MALNQLKFDQLETGSVYPITASYALNSSNAGTGSGGTPLVTGSTYPITSSWSNYSISSSYNVSSSFSSNSTSASYSSTASVALNALTASYLHPISQSLIPSTGSTYSLGSPTNKWKDLYVSTGSIYIGETVLSTSGSTLFANSSPVVTLNTASGQLEVSGLTASLSSSYSSTASVALNALNALTSSYSLNSVSSSYSNFATTASYALNASGGGGTTLQTGSSYPITSSWAINALSASYALNAESATTANSSTSASYALTANSSTSSSYALTASFALNSVAGASGSEGGGLFTVTSDGFNYNIAGYSGTFPSITVVRGQLYYFNISGVSASHPFALRLSSGNTAAVPGTTNNNPVSGNANTSTLIIYRVPNDAPNSIVYQCVIHSSMIGTINIVNQYGTTLTTGSTYPITSSWATNAISSSFATTASTATSATSANTANSATSASYSLSSSFAITAGTATSATSATSANSANTATSASYSLSSSFATNAVTATSATSATSANSANTANSASYSLSSSYSTNSTTATSSSFASTSSYNLNSVSSSYSNIANTATSATSANTATSASYSLSSSYSVNSNTSVSSSFTSTASYNLNSVSSSFSTTSSYNLNSISSSYALTASFSLNGGGGGTTLTTGSSYPITSSWAINATTASYALNASGGGSGGSTQTGSIANQTILYNVTTSQDNTITGLDLSGNKWDVSIIEEWNSSSVDIYFNSCSLLCHFDLINSDGKFIDNSINNNVITSSGGAGLSTSQYKFGGASALFDGTNDYLLLSSGNSLEFGSSDFTIEFWWYPTSIFRQGVYHGSFGADWSLGIDYSSVSTNQKIGIWASSNGSSWNLINADAAGNGIGTITVNQNVWNHIAYVRNGTTWMLFINGVRDLNLTGISGTVINRSAYQKTVGCWFNDSAFNELSGYIDELRITKGIARYTSNFTPPSFAFPNSATQYATKYIGSIGGLNDSNVDYGVEKLSDSSLKIRKMSVSGQPLSGSGALSASVDRVYVNVLNYKEVQTTAQSASYAVSASYLINAASGESFHPFLLG